MGTPITLVGIAGKARSGKGTVAQAIINRWKDTYDVREYTFGAALKQEVNACDQFELCLKNGIEYDFAPDMSDPLCQTTHGKQSKLLQWWGTEFRRAQDSYYWVKKLDAQLKKERPAVALISDVRFINEYYYVKSNNGFSIKCNRLGFVDLSRSATHVSECELDGRQFDFELTVQDGDVTELQRDALEIFDLIIKELTPEVPEIEVVDVAA